MTTVQIDTIQKNYDQILKIVGEKSFIEWDKFSHNSAEIINSIEVLNKKITIFRESQHRNFIQTMKKLKSLDVPDLIKSVKSKGLPKEALRGVLSRFKLDENQKIELVEPVETLKENATKQFQAYVNKNTAFLDQLKKFSNFVDEKIKQSGYVPEKFQPAVKSTIKFNLSEELAAQIASKIKIEFIPGTHYIGLNTYSYIVGGSYELLKQENERITKDARAKQRANFKDPAKYLENLNEYLINSEIVIVEAQKLIARKLGLTDSQLEQSEVLMIERGFSNHLMMMQSQIRSKIKQSITPTQDVPYEVAKQIVVYQTSMLESRKDQIKAIFDGLEKTQQNIQAIPMLLALILNDMVFEKYGYEEQDFMKNINEQIVAQKPELTKIFHEMQIGIIKVMQHIGIVTKQVSEMLEQGATQRVQPQPQQPTPGLMQGMNPMELLQMQQAQQMQQMQQLKNGGQQKPKV